MADSLHTSTRPRASIPLARGSAASCWIDGRGLLVAGGSTPKLVKRAQLYSPETDTWAELAPMPAARFGATAVAAPDGRGVLLVGGGGGRDVPQSRPFWYDVERDAWSVLGVSLTPEYGAGICRVGDEVLVCGGQMERRAGAFFHLGEHTKRRAPSLTQGRFGHALLTMGERVVAIGGSGLGAGGLGSTGTAEVLEGKTWRTIDGVAWRVGAACCALDERRVMVAGGTDEQPSSSTQRIDLEAGTVEETAPMNVARDLFALTRLRDGSLLAIGGRTRKYVTLTSVERYQPDRDTWTVLGELDHARMEPVVRELADGSVLVAAGAHQDEGGVAETEVLRFE